MAFVLDENAANAASQVTLQRHKEILLDYSAEYERNKKRALQALENDKLAEEMQEHRSERQYLLAERGRIEDQHRQTDHIIE